MSCPSLRPEIISALKRSADGEIQKARMNVEVYLHNPVGIGEHPDILAAIQEQLDIIAHQEERVQIIDKYFANHNHE
jgi:hypothetical protein|tara:strand:- start:380 stop:610 length:231 start_codon:yes stop_codon:yes gene_type:complete